MDTATFQNQSTSSPESNQTRISDVNSDSPSNVPQVPTKMPVSSILTDQPEIHYTKNLYPVIRHLILLLSVLFFFALIVFLMHQNGKSIYDNGI